jgi:hypothetical protein
VYIRRPEVYSLHWNLPLAPFSSRLWLCVLVAMGLLSLILPLTCNIQRHHGNRNERAFRLRDVWLCIFGIFCQQGKHSYICRIKLVDKKSLTVPQNTSTPLECFQPSRFQCRPVQDSHCSGPSKLWNYEFEYGLRH